MRSKKGHLMVFAKAPVPGQVKTRLVPGLGAAKAAFVYERLMLRCLSTAVTAAAGAVSLWCTPSTNHPFFKRCAKEFEVDLRLQTNGDIGKRMAHAFQETLKTRDYALLMGSDCPSLTRKDLIEGMAVMQQGADAVISPAEDGGYVLLGLRRYAPLLFEQMPWGTDSVLEETRRRLHDLRWWWHELPKRWDVDRPEDLIRLVDEGFMDPNEEGEKRARAMGR